MAAMRDPPWTQGRGRDNRRTRANEIAGSLSNRARGTFALGALVIFAFSMQIGTMLGAMLLQGETFTSALFDFTNDPWGALLFVVGVLGLLILGLGVAFKAIHGPPRELAGIGLVLVLLATVGGLVAMGVSVQSASVGPAPPAPGAQLSSYLVTTSLQSGCSVNTITNTLTCDLVYNTTSNYFATNTANASTLNKPKYIDIPLHSARVDAINGTFGFVYQVASLATVTTTGASPTVYSPIAGYVPATGSSSGYWLMKWTTGSIASINPPQSAPGTTSGVAQDTLGIGAFGAAANTLNITLPGSGGSSAPTSLYSAIVPYASYSMTVTVQDSTPFTFTLTVVVIGEHA